MRVGKQGNESLVRIDFRYNGQDGVVDRSGGEFDKAGSKGRSIASYVVVGFCFPVDGSVRVALGTICAILDEVGNIVDLLPGPESKVEARR